MDYLQEVLDLSIVFTQPLPGSPSEILAQVVVQCDALGLKHIGEGFTDPLTQNEWNDLHWYLEEYWQWPYLEFAERGERVEASLQEVGRRFYQRLFGSRKTHNIIQVWQQQTNVQHRISIVSEIASILRLPWELLADQQGFLVLRSNHPISLVRRLPTQGEQASLTTTPFQLPLRVLLVTARPEDAKFIDPRNISRELVDELQGQTEARIIELEFLRPPTFSALDARLKDAKRPIHILHFDGHGVINNKKRQGMLLFETENEYSSPILASNLAKVLKNSGIRLVVLTACQSAVNTENDAFSSVSTQLISNGIDAVIAMSSSILVTSAVLYAKAFYHALAMGLPVSIAQEQARQALQKDPHRHLFSRRQDEEAVPVTLVDWWVPHFYQQQPLTLHATIVPSEDQQQQTNTHIHLNKTILSESCYPFLGRTREMLQIERHLLHKRLIILSGFGGIGKTSLAREAADWLTSTGMYANSCFISFEYGGDAALLLGILGPFLGIQDVHSDPARFMAQLPLALQKRSTLLIADNLESLLPDGKASLERPAREQLWLVLRELARNGVGVLLTSRNPLSSEDHLAPSEQVAHLPLRGLAADDAYALASHWLNKLGISRAHVPYAALHSLLTQLDYHPLAIQLVLPTLHSHTLRQIQQNFATLLPQFTDDTKTGRNHSLLASLEYSLRMLKEEQGMLLLRLVVFEGGASENILLDITGIDEVTWRELRTALERSALLSTERVHDAITVPFLPTKCAMSC